MTPHKFINALFDRFSRLKHRQSSFLILFWQTTIKKKLSNFHSKCWDNPFRKIQYGNPNMKVFINAFFGLSCRLNFVKHLFFLLFWQKKYNQKETFPFWLKNAYKNSIWHPKMKVLINALFGIFSSLKHRQTSFLLLFLKSKRNF